MAHVTCSELAYAHPGGDLLFTNVSFRISPGHKVGVVGANGVGKSTLLRVLTGELKPEEGEVAVGGRVAHMPQDVGVARDGRTVRELLLSLAPSALRSAGERMAGAERRMDAGDDAAGIDLATAIGDWSELGGYELEGQWDAACRRIVRSGYPELAERPAVTLSGGERKRLVLDLLFASEADVLLLDEPDNALDVPSKRALEQQIVASKKTVVVISHDRELLAGAVRWILTIEGDGAWMHPGSYAGYPAAREQRQRKLGDAVKRWKEEERRLFSTMKTFKERARYTKTAQVVTESVELEFVDPQGEATSIEADLVYDPADPYAVTMVFRTGVQEVLWTFGRELLDGGRYEPTGDGDVHVWPCLSSHGSAVVIIELCSPDGELLVQASSRSVDHFVTAMMESVPDGQESNFVDFDDELAEILSA